MQAEELKRCAKCGALRERSRLERLPSGFLLCPACRLASEPDSAQAREALRESALANLRERERTNPARAALERACSPAQGREPIVEVPTPQALAARAAQAPEYVRCESCAGTGIRGRWRKSRRGRAWKLEAHAQCRGTGSRLASEAQRPVKPRKPSDDRRRCSCGSYLAAACFCSRCE